MRCLVFVLVFLLIQWASFAQTTELRDYYLPISTVDSRVGSEIQVSVGVAIGLDLKPGTACSVWGLNYTDYPTHDLATLANGQITQVNDTLIVATLTEVDTATVLLVYAGDLLVVKLPPNQPYQGIFHDMIAQSIYFTDQDNELLYTFRDVYTGDSEEYEWEQLLVMERDIQTLAEYLEGTFEDQQVEGGLYDGMSLLTAMKTVKARDVYSFLRYVKAYPAKYRGKLWKISETYATWLINKTPLVSSDLLALIDELSSEEIQKRYGALIDAELILDAGIDAETMAKGEFIDRSMHYMNAIIQLAEISKNNDKMGWAYFQMGRILDLANDAQGAVNWYTKATDRFTATGNVYALTYSLNNLASGYTDLSDYTNGVKYFKLALEAKEALNKDNPSDSKKSDIALAQYRVGDAYYDSEDFENAYTYFTQSHTTYKELNDADNTLLLFEHRSNALAQKGDLEGAVALQNERMNYAASLGRSADVADAVFDIGYIYNGYGEEYEKAIPFYQKSYELHLELKNLSMAALSISNVAQSYWSLKKLDLSIENHLLTIRVAEQSGDKERIAHSWDKLADLYAENGNPKSSLEAYDKVAQLYEEMNDKRLAVTLNEIGDVYKTAKDYIKAVSYFRRSAEMARKNGDYVQSSDAMYDIAETYFAEKKYDLSKHFYEESMRDAAQTDYPSQEIYCLANLALIYGIKDQYELSDSYNANALEKAEKLQDDNIIAYCKYRLAGTSARKRDYVRAEAMYRESYALYEKLEDKTWQVILLNALSGIYSNRGDNEEALQTIDKALAIAEANGDRNNQAYAYVYKSDIYLRVLGEWDKAWEMQEKSMALFQEVDNLWGIADSYLGFGNLKNLRTENVEAINFYKKADSLYAKLGNEYARATPMNNTGTIYYAQGDYEKALEHFHKAIAILDKLGIRDASRSLYVGNVGEVKLEQKQYEEAKKWLEQSLAEAREINDVNQISSGLVLLGRLMMETENYPKAEEYLKESLKIQQEKGLKTHEISSRFSLGKLAYLKKDKSGAHYIDESIQLATKMGFEKELWESYYYKGLMAQEAGDMEQSKEQFINAIESLEKLQSRMVGGDEAKKLFASGEKQIKVYAALVDVLILKGEVELGMQYLERSNTEAMRSKFKQLDIKFKDEAANEKLSQERELKMKLDNLDKAIVDEKTGQSSFEKIQKLEQNKTIAENEYLKFVNTTINTNPELSRHFSGGFHPRKLKTDKNRQLIPEDLVVLSYLPANEKLYIFAATSDTVVAKVVDVTTDELNKNIKYLYNFASHALGGNQTDALRVARGDDSSPIPGKFNTSESKYKEVSELLFNWTIEPVRDVLNIKEKVVVIPTGMLHFLPFQMLGQKLPSGKFDFLIEHYTLFYAHSIEMLYQSKERIGEISILAMANADKTLPASEQEVKDLKAMYPNTDVFIHELASEDKAKTSTGKHNILHFATHGNLDYFDYHKSYLTLAPNEAGGEDGKLTIEEVWEIEDIYSYQMVTLSACKTALTEDFNTGWAVSPATSFIDAGAPTVVASLWAVNDASTALLMKYFYRNLSTMSKVEALRRAQIELSQNPKFSHPYYWSPFILIGDYR